MAIRRVVVVGAGMGGLAAAVELAAAGAAVTVCEAAPQVGGKAASVRLNGRAVAAGPTVLTMPWVFDRLFSQVGLETASAVSARPLSCLARHSWPDAGRLDLFADVRASRDAIGRCAGADEAAAFGRFLNRAGATYRSLKDSFLTASKPGPLALTRRAGIGATLAIRPFTTLWRSLEREFADPRLRQLFGRYATYCGSSPFAAPATLALIAYVEQAGVLTIDGGIEQLALALAAAAGRLGAEVRCGSRVASIDVAGDRVGAVTLSSGERLPADAVVANCDASAFAAGLLGPAVTAAAAPVAPRQRSLSALTWTLLARTHGPALEHHNVFFSHDYRREFDDLFQRRRVPDAPTVYLCAQDRAGDEPPGTERLFCLINAPPDGEYWSASPETVDGYLARALNGLAACGVRLEIRARSAITPGDYARRYPGSGGALYGRASHGWRATFARPANRSAIRGLYLAGGTVHPGPGVPMAALSGMQAARSLWTDLISPSR